MAARVAETPISIATHVQSCLSAFDKACSSLEKAALSSMQKVAPGAINDELGRFRLWCGNIGAHRNGKRSLDHRLRDASHIRRRVVDLVRSLESTVDRATDIVTGEKVPWEDIPDSESEYSDEELPPLSDDGSDASELQQLLSKMAEIITCLMRLSISIQNPTPHDQFKESTYISTAHFEKYDIDHVQSKFPVAEEYLVIRLGKAISSRRQYLRYRDEHRKKLGQGIGPLAEGPTPSTETESTVASSITPALKAGSFSLDDDDCYDDILSQTSYASSGNNLTKLRPPPLPREAEDGKPFECPLCYRFTSARGESEWRKHVYRDLHPYVCTFEECTTADNMYEARHVWFNHELRFHRQRWECIEGCNNWFDSEPAFKNHLQQVHPEHCLDVLLRVCERQPSMAMKADCNLCKESLPSLMQLRRHLGKHHEEMSLFALPSNTVTNDEDDSEDEDGRHSPLISCYGSSEPSHASSIEVGKSSDLQLGEFDGIEDEKEIYTGSQTEQHPVAEIVKGKGTATATTEAQAPEATPSDGGQSIRKMEFLADPVTSVSRLANAAESWACYDFEMHARKCAYCNNPYEVHRSHEQLCDVGHRLAQEVARYIYNRADGETYSTIEEDQGKLVRVEIPSSYDQVKGLLKAIERSLRHRSRTPFVSMDRTYYVSTSRPPHNRTRPVKPMATVIKRRQSSGEVVDWPRSKRETQDETQDEAQDENQSETQGATQGATQAETQDETEVNVTRRGALYEQDLAAHRRNAKQYSVEVREPSIRDVREHRMSGYYR